MPNVQRVVTQPSIQNGVLFVLTRSTERTPWFKVSRDYALEVTELCDLEEWYLLFLEEHSARIDDQGYRLIFLGVKDGREERISVYREVEKWWMTNLSEKLVEPELV